MLAAGHVEELRLGSGSRLATAEFGFAPAITSTRSSSDCEPSPRAAIVRTPSAVPEALLAAGLEYGNRRGVKVCFGFEVSGDPMRPESKAILEVAAPDGPGLSDARLRLAMAVRVARRRFRLAAG